MRILAIGARRHDRPAMVQSSIWPRPFPLVHLRTTGHLCRQRFVSAHSPTRPVEDAGIVRIPPFVEDPTRPKVRMLLIGVTPPPAIPAHGAVRGMTVRNLFRLRRDIGNGGFEAVHAFLTLVANTYTRILYAITYYNR